MTNEIEKLYIGCDCSYPDHQVLFTRYDNDLYIEPMLNNLLPWYKRIVVAVRYIFGFDNNGKSHFDCVLVSPADQIKLKQFLNKE